MAKSKILIVDDEEGVMTLLKLSLEEVGDYEVRVEGEGRKALDSARWFKPDVILLDVIMPDISGTEVAVQLKEDEELKDIPIIFLTAAVSKQQADERGGILNDHPLIAKPVGVEELIDKLSEVLGS